MNFLEALLEVFSGKMRELAAVLFAVCVDDNGNWVKINWIAAPPSESKGAIPDTATPPGVEKRVALNSIAESLKTIAEVLDLADRRYFFWPPQS